MNKTLFAIILSILPLSELRGAIPYAVLSGINPLTAFLITVIPNILIIFVILFFFDYLHKHFYKINYYRLLFDKHVVRSRKKIEKHVGTKWEFFALYLFVAVPLPGTGAFTGTLLAWLFNLKRGSSILAIALGVITAGIIVMLLTLGVIKTF